MTTTKTTKITARRRTAPQARPDPAWFAELTRSGEPITHDQALHLPTVWACVRVIAETIASLPWSVFRKTSAGREHHQTHPADLLLSAEPSPEINAAVFREALIRDVLTWGNGYAEIERDLAYRPVGLHLIRPDIVDPRRETNGELYYWVDQPGIGPPIPIPAPDMFHLRGLGDALAGYSVIRYASETIGLGLAEQSTHAAFVRNDSRPLGLLTPIGPVRQEARKEIEDKWHEMTGGRNKFRTVVLSQQMQYVPLGLPATDAQMIESRRFSILEICRIFRVPPHKIAELQYATFSNITHQSIEFVQDTLTPWIVKMEQEADRKLLAGPERRRTYTKINVNALLRGDFEARTRSYQILFDRGIFSINDILELEDRNTIGPDGDTHFVPLNMQTLERAVAEPEPEPPAPPSDPDAQPQPDQEPDDQAGQADRLRTAQIASLTPMIADLARRLLLRAQDRQPPAAAALHDWATDLLQTVLAGPAGLLTHAADPGSLANQWRSLAEHHVIPGNPLTQPALDRLTRAIEDSL